MAADDRVRGGAVHLRQEPHRGLAPSISPAPSIATTTPTAGRASARCWRSWPAAQRAADRHAGEPHHVVGARSDRGADQPRAFTARAVIVTASTNVLTSGKIKFPARTAQAAPRSGRRKLKLGSYDHIALELPAIRWGCGPTSCRSRNPRAAAPRRSSATCSGSTVCMVDVAGSFGRELSAKGERAMIDFALDLAHRTLRHRHEGDRQALRRHALERGAVGDGRDLGRRPRRTADAQGPLPNRSTTASSSPAKPPTRRCGAPSAAPGNPASAPPKRPCGRSAGDDRTAEGADRLVERQGQRVGAARDAARRRLRDRRRAHHRHRHLRPREHAWRARRNCCCAQLAAAGLPPTAGAHSVSVPERSLRGARWRRRWRTPSDRRHPHRVRRFVSAGRARLSRGQARRHRHRADVSAVAAADRGAGARDDRRGRRDLSDLRRPQAVAEGVRRPPA